MALYFVFSLALVLVYVALIFRLYDVWDKPIQYPENVHANDPKLTVVIIARNEAANISRCLNSIAANEYSPDKYHIILVDDHSDDETISVVRGLNLPNLTILELKNYPDLHLATAYKKNGLKYAVSHCQTEWMVCTDADCEVPRSWLKTVQKCVSADVDFLAMPIRISHDESLISRFQSMDMMATNALTKFGLDTHAFQLANGANMAFRVDAFRQYADLSMDKASGDDVFLAQSIAMRDRSRLRYVNSQAAVVSTIAVNKLSDLLNQRKRWATKSKSYMWSRLTAISALIVLVHISLAVNLVLAVGVDLSFLIVLLFQLFLKLTIDYLFLHRLSHFFRQRDSLKSFLPAALLNIPYYLYMAYAGILGKTYRWKGRKAQ